nr:MAG TPA: hypothetical protein [Caudoviricetes sp.]
MLININFLIIIHLLTAAVVRKTRKGTAKGFRAGGHFQKLYF